ncbi:hypothetical protein EDB84DRAFT_1581644 [Lactarius hengduanensis]|nr:hypothetical protein EDB84DRAFT_1581644 [Lactarius hengduanensis]
MSGMFNYVLPIPEDPPVVIFPQGKELGSRSSELHPLLCEASLLVDTDKLDEQPQESEDEGADEVTRSLGTLTVSDHGLSRFFGSTGGSDLAVVTTLHLQRFSLFVPLHADGYRQANFNTIKDYLPPWDRALVMAESYLANATWLFRSVTRQQLINEMLPAIYGKRTAVMDSSLPNSNAESEGNHYYQLALAALCQQPVLVKPSVVTIQTLHISTIYSAMLGGDTVRYVNTTCTESAVQFARMQIGLHRDPARWESDPRIVQRRRLVFWNLFLADSWHALATGRPPSFNRAFIDCKFPQEDVPANLDPGDSSLLGGGLFRSRFRFRFEGPAEIVARTLTATPPRYSTIQELDLKVQEFRVPPETLQAIRGGPGVDPRSVPIPASMTAFLFSNTRDIFLLYLHRNFFIQALIEDSEDPSRGRYAPSFLTTVQASKNIIRTVEEQFPIQPVILSRFWAIWTFTFSAAVVFAFIATHGPRSPLANDAIIELDKAYSLIEVASQTNRRAKRALAILNRMREKAHRALATVRDTPPPPQPDGAVHSVKQEEIEDDFVVYAGRGRVFLPGSNVTPAPHAVPTPPHDEYATHGAVGESMIGEWLAHQEQSGGYDPHYVTAIEPPRSAPHDQHQRHQDHYQQRQYGYAPEQPQYTVEAVPPPHYMTAPYASYAPAPHPPHQLLHPHNLRPSSHTPGMGQPSHELHPDELADMRFDYAVTVRAPAAELAQLGFAAYGSRMSETWVSFMR